MQKLQKRVPQKEHDYKIHSKMVQRFLNWKLWAVTDSISPTESFLIHLHK